MSARLTPAAEILARYSAGFFPLYDLEQRFYWERLPIRAVIPVTPENVALAKRVGKRAGKRFVIRYSSALEEIIRYLQHPEVKANSWVRREVVELYFVLRDAGLLQTIEAYDAGTGELAGGLLGLVLPGTFIAETMFTLRGDASKVCLCRLVEDAFLAGHKLIDVQTPHDAENLHHFFGHALPAAGQTAHPCIRLGEKTVALPVFLRHFRAAAGIFPGTQGDWLAVAGALAKARVSGEGQAGLGGFNQRQLAVAGPMLPHNYPQAPKPSL